VRLSLLEIENIQKENQELKAMVSKASAKISKLEEEGINALVIGDAVMDGICIVDAEGNVTSINKGYTEITEIEANEILGRNIRELINQNYFTNAVSMDVIRTREKISSMSTITRNERHVLLVGTPIFDKNNDLTKVITVMRNLTDLVNLKEKLERAETKKNVIQDKLNSLTKEDAFRGKSPGIGRIKELIEYVAPTDATVLIMGETGSGKEVVSREIYNRSKRNKGPYVKINCAAIPENLLESELFGYVKGAFTGADNKDKKGLFETANGGTILLDEISEMPLKLQPKLLRVLQEREITPVGGVDSIKIDVRVMAASNKNLEELVKKKLFRADLYYRLNVFPLNIPPLRKRKEDIPDMAALFLSRFNVKYAKDKALDSAAIFALMKYDWPGNVRELENVVERMTIISVNKILTKEDVNVIINIGEAKDIDMADLPLGDISLKEAVRNLERYLVEKALREGGSSYAAARILKTTQPTVIRKAKALGIPTRKS